MSGYLAMGPANDVEAGWLRAPFQSGKAHHFVRDVVMPSEGGVVYGWEAACGHLATSTEAVPMLDAGNWPRCKHCQRRLD